MQPSSGQPRFYTLLRQKGILDHPLCWTSRHLDIVGCQFQDAITSPTASGPDNSIASLDCTGRANIERGSCLEAERLAKSCAPRVKYCILTNILSCEGNPFEEHSDSIPFYFAGQVVHRPRCVTFRRRQHATQPTYHASGPLVGYLDYSAINQSRRERLQPRQHPGGGINAAGCSLFRKKLSHIVPKDWTHDPYLLCVLLSFGQLQERLLHSPQATNHLSRLLVTNASDSESIYLYEAHISSGILRMLDSPSTTTFVNWPTIQRRRIPFHPFKTFKHRLLGALLGPDNLQNQGSLRPNIYADAIVARKLKQQHDAESDHKRILKRRLSLDDKDQIQA
ncbi:hypothetical protein BDW72DRAFT_187705 [Aspergillus terricola var. indicus]